VFLVWKLSHMLLVRKMDLGHLAQKVLVFDDQHNQ
jgi:hypothetical protein